MFRYKNPDYKYEFYSDERIEDFLLTEYGTEVFDAYRKIQIGAAKADFFRYAILYKKGGVYLDIDSSINKKLDDFIKLEDRAVLSMEKNPGIYVQWALIYEAAHPFMEKTMQLMLQNISTNKYPHNVHQMTGPAVYTRAVTESLNDNPSVTHRILGVDYNGFFIFKIPFAKLMYAKGEHWKVQQQVRTVLRPA